MYNVGCYISENGYFIVPDYNIKNLIDFSESNLFTMPTSLESSVKIAGRDGDVVLFSKWTGTEIKVDGEPHLIIKEGDILAIIER